MGDFNGVSKELKRILNYDNIKELYLNANIDYLYLNPRDLEYLIHYLKTDNSIQKIKIDNYNFPYHNYQDKITNMYKLNITLQEFIVNGCNKIDCNLNKNIWNNYKKFYKEQIKEKIPIINDMRHQIMDYMLDENFKVFYFKTKEGRIDMNNLGDFLTFLEINKDANLESIFKIKKKIVQIKKDDIIKKGFGPILSNLRVLYFMRQNNQNDLNKKLELLK